MLDKNMCKVRKETPRKNVEMSKTMESEDDYLSEEDVYGFYLYIYYFFIISFKNKILSVMKNLNLISSSSRYFTV